MPKQDDIVFKLIQRLFEIIFTPEKKIFIFGPKDELYPFVQFKLFFHNQIHNIRMINLQEEFKYIGTYIILINRFIQHH